MSRTHTKHKRPKAPSPLLDLMDFNALCEKLQKSRPFIYHAMKELGLPAIRLGNRWMFSESQTDAWVASLPGVNQPTAD